LNGSLGLEVFLLYWSSTCQIFLLGFRTKQIVQQICKTRIKNKYGKS